LSLPIPLSLNPAPMNQCILMAEIIQDPQLRYTSDTQKPVTDMMVQFSGLRPEDPPATLKVVSWGNLAQEIQEQYHAGDRVILEGRLNMNTFDRPEGFKEKRAELTIQRIHRLGADTPLSASSISHTSQPTSYKAATSAPSPPAPTARSSNASFDADSVAPTQDFDEIPF